METEGRRALADLSGPARYRARAQVVDLLGGSVLIEPIVPSPPLVVIGAGPDVLPVVTIGQAAGLRVTVVLPDGRGAARFVAADRVVQGPTAAVAEAARGASAVVMSHSYDRDREAIGALYRADVPYIGILGPRRRTDRLLGDLGITPDGRIHAPVGLDLGAETPAEIALSIVAEVRAFWAGVDGTSLRDRPGPIHGATEVRAAVDG